MTTELEKTFFDTFGIPRLCSSQVCEHWGDCEACLIYPAFALDYPQITDRILLELICILTEWRQYCASDYIIKAINIDILKNDILKDCLYMLNWYEFKKCGKDIKHQVRTLFEEG